MENYISLLNEYQQKSGSTVKYVEGSNEGPSHLKTFTCRVIVNGTSYPDGTGKTKKEAKQNAARNALADMKGSHNIESTTSSKPVNSNNVTITQRNFIGWLNEYSQKSKLEFKTRESTKMDPGSTTQLCTYVCKYVCNDKEFPEAFGKTKKEAREAAAYCVHIELCQTQNTEVNENCNGTVRSEDASVSAKDSLNSSFSEDSRSTTPDNNYIACLNDFCQKHKRVLEFKLVNKSGPPHNPEFVYKVIINGKEYPEAQGRNSRETRHLAAQHAWAEIMECSFTAQSSEDDTSSRSSEILSQSEEKSSTSDSVVFKDSSCPPMAISPVRSLDTKAKIKLAPSFLSPNGLSNSKGDGPNMNGHNPPKPSAEQTANQIMKSRFLEDFDTISPVGKGGFGRVFRARRKLENKYFAVKIVKSTKKALREVSALAELYHPNIVRYNTAWFEDTMYRHDSSDSYSNSDSGSSTGTTFLYIQMELCEGDTLRVWIDKRNNPNEQCPERRRDAAHISKQILQAVQYIHSKGLIHRDLKPANIMFGSEGGVKVGDFGLVTAAENDNDDQLMERTKKTGTRTYMSPEQVTQCYDVKVDIFALGLTYFELLWNLVTKTEKDKIWDNIKSRKFPAQFSEMFGFEHKLIDKMLRHNPEDRPDATALIDELNQHSTVL
ncbi:interferon-induced, double-stranded RNA-activated protein kinase [Xyrauchen texanus]|uniref:interferon-induced, double-stranded RNA-activated protein kinase n=1 Tax=Xyrauchen texanus TaxID=154827 RepID=UPI0022420063|nr:interferon-induced, double-stranded RNA-activated protein kinase [Xyrauchen texanus]